MVDRKVSLHGLVDFRGNQYSVPPGMPGKTAAWRRDNPDRPAGPPRTTGRHASSRAATSGTARVPTLLTSPSRSSPCWPHPTSPDPNHRRHAGCDPRYTQSARSNIAIPR